RRLRRAQRNFDGQPRGGWESPAVSVAGPPRRKPGGGAQPRARPRPGAGHFSGPPLPQARPHFLRGRGNFATPRAIERRSNMCRYILRFRGEGTRPEKDVEFIRSLPETTVLDDSPRMLLVEAPEDVLRGALQSLPDWVMVEEKSIPLPDPRPKVR